MEQVIKNIDAKYRIIEKLGGGGFSDVYLVEGPGGRCALKLLKSTIDSLKKSALDEFKNEFSVLKDMRHPNIAEILDFGFDESLERYYYTTELIEGKDIIKASEGFNLETMTGLIVQALRALSYLHSYRIYHFDIKAANVLVVEKERPEVKIIDFGLAGIDPRGRLIGTPSYMAPEIVARERADNRADLYSLGVLWYSALTRRNPFRCTENSETLSRQLHFVPPLPSKLVPTLPTWIDAIVMRLLEKNPANRFPNASAVIREINRHVGDKYPFETRETLLSYLPDEGRFVGRTGELWKMEEEIARIKGALGASSGCLVMGDVGCGKTRLLKELKYRSQLKELRVEWASASEAARFSEWCDALAKHLSEGKGPAIFMLDDLQALADDEVARVRLLTLITRARRPAPSASAWIAVAARSIPDETSKATLEAMLPLRVVVEPFTRGELGEYLVSLTGLPSPPAPLLNGLYERTEGNPLFVTELLKSLIAGGGLFDERGRWNETIFEDVGVDFSKAVIPRTVGDLLLERESMLGSDGRALVEALAVAGRPATAVELSEWSGNPAARGAVPDLLRDGILDRAEGFAVRFHNALMGQAIYESLPSERRLRLHDAIAASLTAANGSEDEILEHVSRGSDQKAALEAATALGEKALKAGRGEQAALFLARALKLVPEDDVERCVAVQMELGEAYLISHSYTTATEHFSAVEALIAACAQSDAMARWRAEVLIRLGGTYIKLAEMDRARAALHDAGAALNQAGGDRSREISIENFIGSIHYLEGRLDEAKEIFSKTRIAAANLPPDARPVTNNDLGIVLVARGEISAAGEILAEDLTKAQNMGDDLLLGRAHYNLAQLAQAKGEYGAAVEEYQRCIEVCRRSHNTELMLRAYNGLGNACQISGDADQCVVFYERGMALHEMIGDMRGGAAIAINMGIVEAARERIEAALDHLVPAVEYLRSMPSKGAADWAALSRGLLELGDIARRGGRYDEARERLEEARGIASRVQQASSQRFWIMTALAEVAHEQKRKGELADIISMLEPLASSSAEKGALEELRGRIGSKTDAALSAAISRAEAPGETAPSQPMQVQPVTQDTSSGYRRILEINKLIAAESDLDYVLKTVLFYALEFTGAEAGAILLTGDDGDITSACQRNMESREGELAFSRTVARRVLEGGFPIRTDDAVTDERFSKEESVAVHSLRSILCLPVRARKMIIGVLYLENRFHVGAFSHADMTLLDAFTDQVGLAIETAKLLAASAQRQNTLSGELADASRRAERYEALLGREPAGFKFDYGAIAGRSPAMQRIFRTLDKIADTDLSVFICGESGSGKELIARALHANHAKRRLGKFVAINCGAIPATLIESELFGYKAGAFTGATRDKRGLIEESNGGTLFLDEVSDLAPELQVKLLRVLQERECTRIGDTKPVNVDLRVITASNQDVEEMVQSGGFREDLYYRICQIKIEVPPLRERPEDIAELAVRFIAETAPGRGLEVHPRFMRRLLSYDWPGNVRELQNLMQVCCALSEGDVIDERAIPDNHPLARASIAPQRPAKERRKEWPLDAAPARGGETAAPLARIDEYNEYDARKSWRDYERVIMAKCYEANGFKARPAAVELGIAVTTLYSRIKEYGLEDRKSDSYRGAFVYERGAKLDEYLPLVFAAALQASGNKPTAAIANLRVSQGYFYKVMKKARGS